MEHSDFVPENVNVMGPGAIGEADTFCYVRTIFLPTAVPQACFHVLCSYYCIRCAAKQIIDFRIIIMACKREFCFDKTTVVWLWFINKYSCIYVNSRSTTGVDLPD